MVKGPEAEYPSLPVRHASRASPWHTTDVPDCDVNLNITESKILKNQLQVGSPEDNNAPGVVIWLWGADATPVSISAMFSLSLVNEPYAPEGDL